MPLSKAEREEFLAERMQVATLAVAAGDDRGPLAVPIWFGYQPGGEPWILTEKHTRKARLIDEHGCFTLSVARAEPTVRYVSVDGPVSRIESGSDEHLVALAGRYLSGDDLDKYLEMARADYGQLIAIHMRPAHWLSADLGGNYAG